MNGTPNNNKVQRQNSPMIVMLKQHATGKKNTAISGQHYLLLLSTLATLGTLIAYRAILSYENADSYISELANAPPPLRTSTTVRDDAPHAPFKIPEVRDDDDDVEDDGLQFFMLQPNRDGLGSEYTEDESEDAEEEAMKENNAKKKNNVNKKKEKEEEEAILKAKETSIRIKNFNALDPPKDVLAISATRQDKIDFASIAKKWELAKTSIGLLKQIHSRTVAFDYNRTTDILSLRHPLKTGGTSISRMLEDMFPGRSIPGSGYSNWFQWKHLKEALKTHDKPDDPYWTNMAAFYTHSFLRPSDGGRKNNLLEEIRKQAPALREKRFRLMTIIRRPLDLAASSFYETQCRIGTFADQRSIKDIKDCQKVNLTDVMQKNIDHWTGKCNAKDRDEHRCRKMEAKGIDKIFEHCGSIEKLFEKGTVHNMMQTSLMGDFPRPPELGDDVSRIGENLTPTLQDVSTYTLRDLGGLIDFHPKHKEDFVWFAITERFKESMCLFYYRFQVEPVEEKKSLYKTCRPINVWTEEQKATHIKNEDYDYTVWKAANAIMDIRMEDMRLEIKARIQAGEKLEEIPYVGHGCYEREPSSSD